MLLIDSVKTAVLSGVVLLPFVFTACNYNDSHAFSEEAFNSLTKGAPAGESLPEREVRTAPIFVGEPQAEETAQQDDGAAATDKIETAEDPTPRDVAKKNNKKKGAAKRAPKKKPSRRR